MKALWNAKRLGTLTSRGIRADIGIPISSFRLFGFVFGRLFIGFSIKEPTP